MYGLVDAVAEGERRANVGLAGSRINRLGIRWSNRESTDRANGLAIKNWRPDDTGIGCFPNPPIHPAEIKSGRVAGDARHGDYPASPEWANQAPLEPVAQF